MQLSSLLQPWCDCPVQNCIVLDMQNDSRNVKTGDLFVAYPGAVSDGRQFLAQAVALGAVAIAFANSLYSYTGSCETTSSFGDSVLCGF